MRTAVAYTWVSTAQQGRSGLGLEAQQAALAAFAKAEGYRLLDTFQEVETGKGSDSLDKRPQLSAALELAKKHKARSSSPSSTGSAATYTSSPGS